MSALFILMFGCAALDWLAVYFYSRPQAAPADRRWRRLRLFTKPLTLILLMLWFTQVSGWREGLLYMGLGLLFSLVGDVLLMLPARYFIGGLLAFWAAHIFYIIFFSQDGVPLRMEALVLLLGVSLSMYTQYRKIRVGVAMSPNSKQLRWPVFIYSVTISVMLLSALLTLLRPQWSTPASALAVLGALMFFTSDAVLALNRFVNRVPYGDVLVMITYHLGQFALVAAALMRY